MLSSMEMPLMVTTWSTPGTFPAMLEICCMTASVRSFEAPSGNCALTIR